MITTSSLHPFCTESEAPTSAEEQLLCKPMQHAGYVTGLSGIERPTPAGQDSGVMCMVIGMVLLVAFSFKHWSKFFKIFTQDLVSVRRRVNAFDDRTMSENRILIALIIQLCICQGILLLTLIGDKAISHSAFASVGLFSLLSVAFYLFQLLSYSIIGNVFTDKIGASQWVKGFNASQAFLGLALLIPALIALFYPTAISAMVVVAIILYLASRIIFIVKGFRIFYQGIGSLLYFALYLLAMEIIPIVIGIQTITNCYNSIL